MYKYNPQPSISYNPSPYKDVSPKQITKNDKSSSDLLGIIQDINNLPFRKKESTPDRLIDSISHSISHSVNSPNLSNSNSNSTPVNPSNKLFTIPDIPRSLYSKQSDDRFKKFISSVDSNVDSINTGNIVGFDVTQVSDPVSDNSSGIKSFTQSDNNFIRYSQDDQRQIISPPDFNPKENKLASIDKDLIKSIVLEVLREHNLISDN